MYRTLADKSVQLVAGVKQKEVHVLVHRNKLDGGRC